MKHQQLLRDLGITLTVLTFGLLLVWAGNNNATDAMVAGLVIVVPMFVTLAFAGRQKPSTDLDN